jgi:tetratricopeptide (TPR) repeat protein
LSRSTRYTFILVVVALSACLAAVGGWRFARASAPVNGPIILISIDSVRTDHLPAYGYDQAQTPAIDDLAAEGVVFDRAYSHVPQTLPAHAALLTGRLPFETGVPDGAGFTLSGSVRTVADLLKDRGYATGGVVSSFLLRRETGIARGFTFFDGELPVARDGDPAEPLMRDGVDSEQIAEHWLSSVGTSRVFLFLHVAEPYQISKAPVGFDALSPYDAQIALADASVGRLVQYLKAHQLYDRSTILLVSDHGQGLGDHGEQGHGLLAYDESLHVPLIIKAPAGEGARRHVGVPVQLIDIVPTILDLAKAPGAGGLRGRSLTALISGGSIQDAPIYAESLFGDYRFATAPFRTLIQGRYQYIAAGEHVELLDLEAPFGERHDIREEKADVARALRGQLASMVREPAAKPGRISDTERQRFERLGYVGVPGELVAEPDDATTPMERVAFVERYRAAVKLSLTGDTREAIDAWRSLLRDEPQSADLWEHLARTASIRERNDVAIDGWKHVLDLNPGAVSAHIGLASSSLRARRFDDVVAHANAVVDDGSADAVQKAEAHELLARVAVARKEPEAARVEAALAEEADAARPVKAFIEGRLALDEGRYEDAAGAFDRALAAAKKAGRAPLSDLRVYAAEALVHVGRSDDAEPLLQSELRLFPANIRARTALQSLYHAAGRASDAAALAQH